MTLKSFIKKIIAAVIILVGLSCVQAVCASEARFPDVDGHWAQDYIEALAEKRIITGMGDGLFHPELPVTTAQFVTMILQSSVGSIPPVDDYWASGYINEAYNREIIIGNDLDNPDAPLIRSFAARIGLEALRRIWNEEDEEDIFAADKLIDLYVCYQCVWSTGQFYVKGIMTGMPDNQFHGDDNFTRAEASIVMMRMLDPSFRAPQKIELPEATENGKITAIDAERLSGTYQNVLLIDVRTPEERASGYIPNSINISIDDLLNNFSETGLLNEKNKIIIVYCQEGSRALSAYNALKDAGFENVYNLGGIDAWPYDIIKT